MACTISGTQMDIGTASVIESAGHYYWMRRGSEALHGPFAAPIDAIADLEADDVPDDDEFAIDDAEFGVGAAAWIDPDSGHVPGADILHVENLY